MLNKYLKIAGISCLGFLLGACGNPPLKPSEGHIRAETVRPGVIPQPVKQVAPLPPPKPTAKLDTYSVVVTNVPAQEILFALARDAKLNLDIHAGIQGVVTLNAIDQTLQQILTRIAKQVDMRYEIDGPNLVVMPDKPFLKTYKIDFLNMARSVKSTISTTTQISSAGGATGVASGTAAGTASTLVTSDTKNDLMESLISNVTNILLEEDRLRYRTATELTTSNSALATGTGAVSTDSSSGKKTTNRDGATESSGLGSSVSGSGSQAVQSQAAAGVKTGVYVASVPVFANRETGVLLVRATSRQHEKVQEFIDVVMNTARRQVLIEATIVEVRLNDNYKQGINWSALQRGGTGFQLRQAGTAGLPSGNAANIFVLDYLNPTSRLGNLTAQISLLESFGTVKVLSSPKLSVMNNQTATLKVADNRVYFTVTANTTAPSLTSAAFTTFTTTPNQISVGFVMNVTPQISDADAVTINVRPTITRIIGFVNDPNPSLAAAGVTNPVPEIQTREMESIIKIDSGQVAVMGGLMQDEINNATDSVPGLSKIPGIGNFFSNRNETSTKTELVIFLRPIVVKDASIEGDFKGLRGLLPGNDFFAPSPPSASADVSGGK